MASRMRDVRRVGWENEVARAAAIAPRRSGVIEGAPVPGGTPVPEGVRLSQSARLAAGAEGALALGAGAPWGTCPAVLHLDIDAFFASVEQLRNPALRGLPVAVGSGVVASASYEARRYGIRAGTRLGDARRMCPELTILAGHAPTYRAFAEQVFGLAAGLSPDLETYLDDALVDLTGTERLHGHLIRAAARLRREIRERTGLSVSLGLASNRMVARMATRLAKPGGFVWLRPGGEAAFVARRPIEELPGIGYKRARLLREMGLTRIGELRRFRPEELRDLFGEIGLLLAARARGEETRAVATRELPRSIRRETSFDAPQTETATIEGMLHYLTERAAAQARRLGARPRRLRVHLRWADGEAAARSVALAGETHVTERLYEEARALLGALRTRRLGLRNLGLEVSELVALGGAQLPLFPETDDIEASRAATDPGTATRPTREEIQGVAAEGLAGVTGVTGMAGVTEAVGASAAAQSREARPPRRAGRRGALDVVVDDLRERFGFRALVRGQSLELLDRLPSDAYGFVLRTPCLTR